MKTYVISLYYLFRCLGGECPHSCCKGWVIPVDEETYGRYRLTAGLYGRYLKFHVKRHKDMYVMRQIAGRCPHHNSDGLCQFQANGQPRLMPLICRVYPRDVVSAGHEIEVTLELSCISMARIFLEHLERLSFLPTEETMEPIWEMDNDDPGFYAYLKEDREAILDHVWDTTKGLDVIWQALYAYVYHIHDLIVMDRIAEAKRIKISYERRDIGIYYLERRPTYAFYSLLTIDRMVLDHINYGNLRLRERRFYQLIRGYKKYFTGDLYANEADRFFDETVRKMMADGYERKYRAYFSYCIQEIYLKAYETYHVLRQFLFAVLYVELLMIFDMVDYLDRGGKIAPIERQSEILMLCEQGLRHNTSLTKNLFQIIREEFL